MRTTDNGRGFEFGFQDVRLLLERAGAGMWRLRSERGGAFDGSGAAQTLAADLGESIDSLPGALSVGSFPDHTEITAEDGARCILTRDELRFSDKNGADVITITSVSESGTDVSATVRAQADERFYGLGERFDSVQRRGRKVRIYAVDRWCRTRGNSYIPIPFLMSSRRGALFLNRYEPSVFDVCSRDNDLLVFTQLNAPLDLYLFDREEPAEIMRAYCGLTGFAPMPPEWAFGTFVCRYHPEFGNKEGVFAMMRAMSENDFPWDAVILEGFDAFDPDKLPELRETAERVRAAGKHVMLYEPCGRFPDKAGSFGVDDSCAVRSGDGVRLSETDSFNLADNAARRKMRCIDITGERGREAWARLWDIYTEDIGVDGAKIDFCEQFPDDPSVSFADGRSSAGAHHWYPTLYNALQFRRFSAGERGGVCFSRGGSTGAQRYPFVWAGDQRREFRFLPVVIRAALSLGLSGVPFVSWDLAGYRRSFNSRDLIHEDRVFIRGLEFTAFSPNMQTHGTVQRPYDFDARTRAVYHAYSHIHECLKPYLIEQAAVSCATGMPMMRHLFFYDRSDPEVYDTEDEYMLGCGLLVAPVLDRRQSRDIYLPEGEWTDIFDGKVYKGGRRLRGFKVPLEKIAVFKAAGAPSACLESSLENAAEYLDAIRDLMKQEML